MNYIAFQLMRSRGPGKLGRFFLHGISERLKIIFFCLLFSSEILASGRICQFRVVFLRKLFVWHQQTTSPSGIDWLAQCLMSAIWWINFVWLFFFFEHSQWLFPAVHWTGQLYICSFTMRCPNEHQQKYSTRYETCNLYMTSKRNALNSRQIPLRSWIEWRFSATQMEPNLSIKLRGSWSILNRFSTG